MQNLQDIKIHSDILNDDYMFEGARIRLHPTAPIFEGICFMALYEGKWQMFTCRARLSGLASGMFSNAYTVSAHGLDYSFPKYACKRIMSVG